MSELRDVIAVNIETKKVRVLAQGKSERDAEAIVKMAVMRRGVEEEFFVVLPAGWVAEGDTWTEDDEEA